MCRDKRMGAYDEYGRRELEEHLKSWGEIQISRFLRRNDVGYYYEHPMAVIDDGGTRIWYPDFYLYEYGMIIEYFGMNGNGQYIRSSLPNPRSLNSFPIINPARTKWFL